MTGLGRVERWEQRNGSLPPPRAPLPLALTPTRHPHAEPAAKRRKLSSEAVDGIGVGTDELDRLWNLTEDNVSGNGPQALLLVFSLV